MPRSLRQAASSSGSSGRSVSAGLSVASASASASALSGSASPSPSASSSALSPSGPSPPRAAPGLRPSTLQRPLAWRWRLRAGSPPVPQPPSRRGRPLAPLRVTRRSNPGVAILHCSFALRPASLKLLRTIAPGSVDARDVNDRQIRTRSSTSEPRANESAAAGCDRDRNSCGGDQLAGSVVTGAAPAAALEATAFASISSIRCRGDLLVQPAHHEARLLVAEVVQQVLKLGYAVRRLRPRGSIRRRQPAGAPPA